MKITFTCEECGFTDEIQMPNPPYDGVFRTMPIPPHTCKKPKLTYGPLTEEMVAEALWAADTSIDRGHWKGRWIDHNDESSKELRAQARFVLRLLDDFTINDINPSFKGKWNSERYRELLLDLAKQP